MGERADSLPTERLGYLRIGVLTGEGIDAMGQWIEPGELVVPFDGHNRRCVVRAHTGERIRGAVVFLAFAHPPDKRSGAACEFRQVGGLCEGDIRAERMPRHMAVESSVTPYGVVMAGALISALPLIIVFFFVQKRFVEGIAMAGRRGTHRRRRCGLRCRGPSGSR